MTLVAGLRSIAARPGGPTIVALGFAVLSIPFATAAIVSVAVDAAGDPVSVDLDLALVMAVVAVLAGALVGGAIGGLAVRRRPDLGLALAIGTAWPAAVATLSIVPVLLGRDYRAVRLCIDSCSAVIRGDSALSAIGGYAISVVFTALYAVPAAGILLLVAWELGRRRHRKLRSIFVASAIVAIDGWSMSTGLPAAAALVVGALVWAMTCRTEASSASIQPSGPSADPPLPPGWGSTTAAR